MTDNSRNLVAALRHADAILERATGLKPFERRTVACYCIATHFMDQFSAFPILVLNGPPGTGKTTVLRACNLLCHRPTMFSAARITAPALRDKLEEANGGTAIMDEADSDNCQLETHLTLRYMRETANAAKMVPLGEGEWERRDIHLFGATILHKRDPFADPAVDSRAIFVKTEPVTGRVFAPLEELTLDKGLFHEAVGRMQSTKLTAQVAPRAGLSILPRIVDTYRPVIAVAKTAADNQYLAQLAQWMEAETAALRDGQAYEPGPLLVQGILALSEEEGCLRYRHPIKVEGDLVGWLMREHKKQVTAWQAAKMLRGYGFDVKRSGGVNRVYITDIGHLIKICRDLGILDEVAEREAKRLGIDSK